VTDRASGILRFFVISSIIPVKQRDTHSIWSRPADHSGRAVYRHELSLLAGTLGSWVQIPLETWMFVYVYSVFVLLCV
jgi:hypothetical protein